MEAVAQVIVVSHAETPAVKNAMVVVKTIVQVMDANTTAYQPVKVDVRRVVDTLVQVSAQPHVETMSE